MLEELLARLGRALDSARLDYMLIGGQAVLLHGQPRVTQDVDVTLGVDCSHLPRVLNVTRELNLEVLIPDVERFVEKTNVLPAREPASGLRFDFIFSYRAMHLIPLTTTGSGLSSWLIILGQRLSFATGFRRRLLAANICSGCAGRMAFGVPIVPRLRSGR